MAGSGDTRGRVRLIKTAIGGVILLALLIALLVRYLPSTSPRRQDGGSPAMPSESDGVEEDQPTQKDLKSEPLPASPVAASPDAMPTAAAPVAVVPVAVPLLPSKQIQEAPGASIRLPTGIIISAPVEGLTCTAADFDELTQVLEDGRCTLVTLTGMDYVFDDQIVVRGQVSITGNAASLPFLDCRHVIRCFQIMNGGYLELRYLRVAPGEGIIRPRGTTLQDESQGEDVARQNYGPDKIIEIRGGVACYELGASGGLFVNVIFLNLQWTESDVEDSWYQTITGTGMRVYGNHIFMAAGRLRIINCLFFLTNVLTASGDNISIGGDVLVLGGEVEFTNVMWQETVIFGNQVGAGVNLALFGGVAMLTNCYFEQNYVGLYLTALGQAFLVGGGVFIMTNSAFTLWGAIIFFAGTGDFTVLEGVMVVTGISIQYFYGMLAGYAAGFDYTVGNGILVKTGSTVGQWMGLSGQGFVGGYGFVGSGEYLSFGSPYAFYAGLLFEAGQGATAAVMSGTAALIGSPIIDMAGIATSVGLGSYISVNSGLLILIGTPFVEIAAIDYWGGLGGAVYVGAGGAVMGRSPFIEFISILNEAKDFWIQANCEPSLGAWAPGEVFWVAGSGDCDPYPEEHRRTSLGVARKGLVANATMKTSQKMGLLAWDMERVSVNLRDQEGRATIANILTPELRTVAERMQGLLGARSPVTTRSSTTFNVGKWTDEDAYCGVCGDINVTGRGASQCKQSPSCKDLPVPSSTAKAFDFKDVDYPASYLVMADVELVTTPSPPEQSDAAAPNVSATAGTTGPSTSLPPLRTLASSPPSQPQVALSKALSAADVASALRRALGEEPTDKLNVQQQLSTVVKAYRVELDPFNQLQARSSMVDPIQTFKVVILVTSQDRSDSFKSLLVQEQERRRLGEGEGALLTDMRQNLLLDTGVEVREALVSFDRVLFTPKYNTEALLNVGRTSASDLGTYSVVLIDPTNPSSPASHVQYGETYVLQLRHFPPQRLVRVEAVAAEGERVAIPILTLMTDKNGVIETKLKFKASTVAPGVWYLQGVDLITKAHGSSPVILFTAKARRRKLYGPLMEF